MKVEFFKADNVQQSFFFFFAQYMYDDFPKKVSDWVYIVKEIQCKFFRREKKLNIMILSTEVEITIKHEISGGNKTFGPVISALTPSKLKHKMINNETNSYLTKYNVFNMVTIRY